MCLDWPRHAKLLFSEYCSLNGKRPTVVFNISIPKISNTGKYLECLIV